MKFLRLFLLTVTACNAADIYFAASAAGSNNGSSCANAYAYNDGTHGINVSSNWSPGNTLHICGTITLGNNATFVTSQNNGTSGSIITLKFESSAVLVANYWNTSVGGIVINNNYITVDGGTNGLMTATQNGDSLANQQQSIGINISGSNVEVKNLTGTNLYQRNTSNGSGGNNTVWININPGADHIKLDTNNISNARALIFTAYSTLTDLEVYNNTLDYSSWMIVVGDDNTSNNATGILIYNNTLGPHFNIWLDLAQTMHCDGIFLFAVNSGSRITGQVYNNYVHGDMCSTSGVNCTGYIFLDGNYHSVVFNNVLVQENTTGTGPEALIVQRGDGNPLTSNSFYNNTLTGVTGANPICFKLADPLVGGATGIIYENNILSKCYLGYSNDPNNFTALSTVNYNDVYAPTQATAADNAGSGPPNYYTFSAWQGLGFDLSGSSGNPNLNSSYQLQSGSAAISLGTNLTSLSITALNSDKSGNPRPSTGSWDAGTYNFISSVPAIISTSPIPDAVQGVAYSYTFTATNFPTSWSCTSCPSWATLNSTTGIFSGTPNAAIGLYSFSVTATNGSGSSPVTPFTVTVDLGVCQVMGSSVGCPCNPSETPCVQSFISGATSSFTTLQSDTVTSTRIPVGGQVFPMESNNRNGDTPGCNTPTNVCVFSTATANSVSKGINTVIDVIAASGNTNADVNGDTIYYANDVSYAAFCAITTVCATDSQATWHTYQLSVDAAAFTHIKSDNLGIRISISPLPNTFTDCGFTIGSITATQFINCIVPMVQAQITRMVANNNPPIAVTSVHERLGYTALVTGVTYSASDFTSIAVAICNAVRAISTIPCGAGFTVNDSSGHSYYVANAGSAVQFTGYDIYGTIASSGFAGAVTPLSTMCAASITAGYKCYVNESAPPVDVPSTAPSGSEQYAQYGCAYQGWQTYNLNQSYASIVPAYGSYIGVTYWTLFSNQSWFAFDPTTTDNCYSNSLTTSASAYAMKNMTGTPTTSAQSWAAANGPPTVQMNNIKLTGVKVQ